MGTYQGLWGPMEAYGDLWGPIGAYGDLLAPNASPNEFWVRTPHRPPPNLKHTFWSF